MNVLCGLMLLVGGQPIASKFEQVLPEPPAGKLMARTPNRIRAAVLIHGLHVHPFSRENVGKPILHSWQGAQSRLVKEIASRADVFAFAYAQDVSVDAVASRSRLGENIRALREMGYLEIVLIGHSAGGLIAREFVEDNPDAGVTRVIQVCPPNGGSSFARLKAVRKNQLVFLESLTKPARRKVLEARKDRRIPDTVQFVCVVGTGAPGGDGIVACEAQWTDDLQRQGIPAVALEVTHPLAMHSAKAVSAIAKLVVKDLDRWRSQQVAEARRELFAH